ncbi:MAG: phosphatidylserine decarboxylase [Thermoanaerobaculia bacterium]
MNRLPLAPEGWIFIIPVMIMTALALLVQWYLAAILLGGVAALLIGFFRDPRRRGSAREIDVLSPADGTVVQILEVPEDSVWPGLTTQVSILMSVFDVHVNRAPISGKIVHYQYAPGKNLAAADKSSSENEQNLVVIDDGRTRVGVRQIAGVLARRIVFDRKEGDKVARGERIGMIRFGSRVDLLLPREAEVLVSLREKVKVGLTVMAHLQEKE